MKKPISIENSSSIRTFLFAICFRLYFSKPAFTHIVEFVYAAVQAGFRGKIVDIDELAYTLCHRTTYGHFLSKGVWDEQYIWRFLQKSSLAIVYKKPPTMESPIFVIYDDTISEKTRPSSKALHPIEKTGDHKSHLKGKMVWGHQILATLLLRDGQVLPYKIERYEKEVKSKIEMVCEKAKMLPVATGPAYALMDSWFTCEPVIDAHLANGYHAIGGLKINRVIFPQGVRIQIQDFAQYIHQNDVRLVTVGSSKYWTYRYEGPLKGIDNAVVILCWPEKAFKKDKCLRAFLCTDVELSTQTILQYYSQRWPIEIFFRQSKGNLGLNKYQVRSEQAIDRILVLITLSFYYCVLGTGDYKKLGVGLKKARKTTEREKYSLVYNAGKQGIPLKDVLAAVKVA